MNKKRIKDVISFLIVIIIAIIIKIYVFSPVRVNGTSMVPTLEDGYYMLLNEIGYHLNGVERFDIVVINSNNEMIIKRVIGLPGDTVEYKYNKLYVNGKEVIETFEHKDTDDFKLSDIDVEIIPDDYYFVVGDNRSNSKDSRIIGLIHKNQIMGKTNFIIFPFNRFGKVE